ncbi:MAG: TIGR04283 family arsenosugar biosynthesis glycosyltransferase [Thermodesulfobacteriota bacterium]
MDLTIIIPTLNEAEFLASTISHLRKCSSSKYEQEIIVVDSGSEDATCEIAKGLGLSLVEIESKSIGKSYGLNEAAKLAKGKVLMFLDADTLVPSNYDELIFSVLENKEIIGGAFEFCLDGPEFGLRVVELINRTRYRIRQRYYGDQGVFLRARVFERVGGYPNIGLLESAHLCRKLRKEGKLKLIKKNMKTSPRRFIQGGIYKVLAGDIKIWFLDLLGISVSKYAPDYWRENKFRSKS